MSGVANLSGGLAGSFTRDEPESPIGGILRQVLRHTLILWKHSVFQVLAAMATMTVTGSRWAARRLAH